MEFSQNWKVLDLREWAEMSWNPESKPHVALKTQKCSTWWYSKAFWFCFYSFQSAFLKALFKLTFRKIRLQNVQFTALENL